MAKMRVTGALKDAVRSASDRIYHPGDHVLIWRERQVKNRIGECIGPFSVQFVDETKKLVYVRDTKIANARPLHVAQVKLYCPPEDKAQAFIEFPRERFCEYGNPHDDLGSVYLMEITDEKDPRSKSPEMSAA